MAIQSTNHALLDNPVSDAQCAEPRDEAITLVVLALADALSAVPRQVS